MRKNTFLSTIAIITTVSLLPNGIFGLTAMAESPDLGAETEAAPGNETVLTISDENNPGIASFDLQVNYDENKLNGEIL